MTLFEYRILFVNIIFHLILIIFGAKIFLTTIAPAEADEVTLELLGRYESLYLDGLKDLDFYETAEYYCQRKINQPKTDSVRKIGYARELLQTLTERLLVAKPDDRDSIYSQLENVGKPWRSSEIQSPYQPLFWLQVIVTDLKYAELLRLEAEIHAQEDDKLENAKELFRRIDQEAQERLLVLQEEIRTANTKTSQQFLSYSRYLQLYQALALKNLALCYSANSPEHADLLQQTTAILDKLLGITAEDSVFWNAWLDSASCSRLLGEWERSTEILRKLTEKHPPEPILLQAKIETIELALAQGNLQNAVILVENAGISPETSAEFELVKLKLFLQFWKTGEQSELWKSRILEQALTLEKTFGPYWEHRAQLLMTQFEDVFQGDTQLPEQRGNAAFRSGNESEAIRLYDLAAESARTENPEEAFRLLKKAGLVVHSQTLKAEKKQQDNLTQLQEETFRRFRNIAMNYPANPEAPTVHLWSIFHAGRLVEAGRLPLSKYISLLEEHFLTWPQSAESESLRVDTAKLLEHQRQYRQAIQQLGPVTNRSELAKDAVQTAKRCFDVLINSAETPGNVRGDLALEASQWFFGRIVETSGNEADRVCLLEAARYRLIYAAFLQQMHPEDSQKISAGYQAAEEILKTGLSQYSDDSDSWKSTAESLLACALAGQGRLDEAVQNLKNINQGDPGTLLSILTNLEQMAKTSSPDTRKSIANMQLVVMDSVKDHNESLTDEQKLELGRLHAVALADAGTVQESINLFRELLNSHRNSLPLYVSLGHVLMEQNDPTTLETALKIWQHVESQSPPQSDSWWDAKEAMLNIQIKHGNHQNARKALELLEILYPELGGSARKQRIQRLFNEG